MDLHGALVKVTKSINPSLVGMKGIIFIETRETFKMISKDDKVRSKFLTDRFKQ
jgi:ribonuclease P protein subunit POP4